MSVEIDAKRIRVIADQLPVLMGYIDRQEVYLYANDTYTLWSKKTPETVIGKCVREVIGEEFYRIVKPKLDVAYSGKTVIFEVNINYPGGPRYVRANYTPDICPDTGEVLGINILIQDQSNLEKATKNEIALSILNHDLRNALSIAKLSTELIARSTDKPESVLRYTKSIFTGLDRAERMSLNIRDYSRIETGTQLTVSPEKVSLNEILETVIHELRIRDWSYGKNHETGEIVGYWDRTGVHRILELILGRLKASGDQANIELRSTATECEVSFRMSTVEDNRWDTYLTIARAIAESHGGTLSENKEEGKTERVSVILPMDCRHS